MENYPIIINGMTAGSLSMTADGLFTLIHGEYPAGEGIVRLWLYGDGGEEYLGVMEPCPGGLSLTRRLSAAQMKKFPPSIRYAAPQGEAPPPEEREAVKEKIPEAPPVEIEPPEDELLWFSTPDGRLTAFDGTKTLVAIPAEIKSAPPGMTRNICGRDYVVLPSKAFGK